MDPAILQSKARLQEVQSSLSKLYPTLISVGSPFYICGKTRVATKLVFADSTHRCVAVAKLLLEAFLGRRLQSCETCDHIDGNPLNDDVSNLQVLSRSDNARKGPSQSVRNEVARKSSLRMRGVPRPDLIGNKNGLSKLTDEQAKEIRVRSNPYVRGNDAVLAREYGVSRELISQIRRNVLRCSSL